VAEIRLKPDPPATKTCHQRCSASVELFKRREQDAMDAFEPLPVTPAPTTSAASEHSTYDQLVRRLKAGDADAFEDLVRSVGGRLLAAARRLVGDEDAARDVVQTAFLSAFRAMQTFDGKSQLTTWLHRIVINAALMRIRARRRKPEQSITDLLPAFDEEGRHAHPVTPWPESPESALARQETQALVRSAIAALPEKYRTVLLLRDIEELSTREAAEALRISDNAVKLRLHRARQALATLIRQRMPGRMTTVTDGATRAAAEPARTGAPIPRRPAWAPRPVASPRVLPLVSA
jgi:RNA polymerase sigma-70 factor, ECF subfamily